MNENAKKWAEALRSGKYRQGNGALCRVRSDGREYCCLGVASDLAVRAGIVSEHEVMDGDYIAYSSEGHSPDRFYLDPAVTNWLGLGDTRGSYDGGSGHISLAIHNDEGRPFERIAEIIESEPEGLFDGDK